MKFTLFWHLHLTGRTLTSSDLRKYPPELKELNIKLVRLEFLQILVPITSLYDVSFMSYSAKRDF